MTFGVSRSEKFFHTLKSGFPDKKIVLVELVFQYWLWQRMPLKATAS
jgi:hypothetical protein